MEMELKNCTFAGPTVYVMGIRRIIYRTAVRGMEFLFLSRRPGSLKSVSLSLDKVSGPDSIDVYTIAFNNAQVIEIHNRYVARYLTGNVTHIVVDNSSDSCQAEKIRQVCASTNTPYIRLHKNRMGVFSGSYSHAAAVNWTYRHIVKSRQPFGFGFIDHDIFPVATMDMASVLKDRPVYGARRQRGNAWYLSAIISFYRFDFISGRKFDFMPVTIDGEYLDSGGSNWLNIYSTIDSSMVNVVSERTEPFRDGNQRHQDLIEFFDEDRWVHTINGSYWKSIDVVKEQFIPDIISRYEQKNSTPDSLS